MTKLDSIYVTVTCDVGIMSAWGQYHEYIYWSAEKNIGIGPHTRSYWHMARGQCFMFVHETVLLIL